MRSVPRSLRVAFLAVALCAAAALHSAERVPGKAAIASAHPLATQAGLDMIAKGGNAFDAAAAVAFALSPWAVVAVLAATPWWLKGAARDEARLPVSRFAPILHHASGDPASWTGR